MANHKISSKSQKVAIIGAGIGGLACAVELAHQGYKVQVHEALPYPGGCASTFYRQGYRFDTGATLAAGFGPGGVMDWVADRWGIVWDHQPAKIAMTVHISDHEPIHRYTDASAWKKERQRHFGASVESFWEWQEELSSFLWSFAKRFPPWPVRTLADLFIIVKSGNKLLWDYGYAHFIDDIVLASLRPLSSFIKNDLKDNLKFQRFLDAQLLISAQTTSSAANALYSSVALDLSRQGVSIFPNGIGTIAQQLISKIKQFGGEVIFRSKIESVTEEKSHWKLISNKNQTISADHVVFNTTPWNADNLLGSHSPIRPSILSKNHKQPQWGAYMLYMGVDSDIFADNPSHHHQIVSGNDLAEGNSLFLSRSSVESSGRAPKGQVAVTVSTHTRLDQWWEWYHSDKEKYSAMKLRYQERILDNIESVFPGFIQATQTVMPGTPVTFQFFTQRHRGWVGGFPQTNLFQNIHPRLDETLWLVGDSIFPGQSIPATSLGGIRVARDIINEIEHN